MSRNEALTEIQAFLDWNPPNLTQGSRRSPSKSTRSPSLYDKHIREDLILREVIPLPSLRQSIAAVVDESLKSISNEGITLPSPEDITPASRRALRDLYWAGKEMTSELHVVDFYQKAVASDCASIASILEFYPHLWVPILEWTSAPTQSRFAIADGFLRIEKYLSDIVQEKISPPQQYVQYFVKMKEQGVAQRLAEVALRFDNSMTWEFKSMSVGDDTVMNAIGFRKPFRWKSCDDVSCKHHKLQMGPYENSPDATKTPWTIPSDPHAPYISQPAVGLRRGNRERKLTQRYSSAGGHSLTGQRSKGPGDNADDKGKGKATDVSHSAREELTTDKFLQQIWAQAVINDTTLVCLNSGTNEYIGVRHRATQRLYVSDLIKPSECEDPHYGKLHVGLYIAAVQDAMDRAQQLKQQDEVGQGSGQGLGPATDPSGLGGGGAKDNSRDGHDRRGTGGSGTGPGGNFSAGETQGACRKRKRASGDHQELFDAVGMRKLALIYLSYGIYESPAPALFIRKEISQSSQLVELGPRPSLSALDRKYHFLPKQYVSLILISEIAEGATGKVHGAKLEVLHSGGQILTSNVIVKMAIMDEQKERLENEYLIYRHLASKKVDGILDVLGIFNDIEGEGTCLVMTDGGCPLKQGQPLSSLQRSAFLHTLKEIHAAGVLHFDIRKQNLLVNEFGKTAIIDFDQSERGANSRDMECEYSQLENILDSLEEK